VDWIGVATGSKTVLKNPQVSRQRLKRAKAGTQNSNDNLLGDTHKTVIASSCYCARLGLTGDFNALTIGVNLANRWRRGPERSGWLAVPSSMVDGPFD
jgi:hypothetical protein